ncbi:MAG: Rid family hydrolase, partial [Alphaproteobacteria bacterium]|nr:Rid family hydrolase [Alphaproteobacteria bacterium]
MIEIVRHMVDGGPKAVAPFHHAVTAGDFHFITGQMPTMPDDPTRVVEGGIEAQTRRVMDNLKLV